MPTLLKSRSLTSPKRPRQRSVQAAILLAAAMVVGPVAAQSDRVLWRFRMPSDSPGRFLAVAPDGTVYASDSQRLYAIHPDGSQRWVANGTGRGRPIQLDSNGMIYTGDVQALRPDGSLLWSHTAPHSLLAGPGLGPDGNLYVVAGWSTSHAVYSLDRQGNQRWSQTVSQPIIFGSANSEIQFGDPAIGQFYFGAPGALTSGPHPRTFCFDFGGQQRWYRSPNCQLTYAKISPQNFLTYVGPGMCGMTALSESGSVRWNAPPPSSNGFGGTPVQQVFGVDGTCYTADLYGSDCWAVDTNGNTRWFLQNTFGQMSKLGVSPDDRLLLDGGNLGFGQPGRLRAYATVNGSLQWQVDLPTVSSAIQDVYSEHPVFSPDGRVAYFTTRFRGSLGYSYVYAVDLCDSSASWSNYGSGWPGANGVPQLTATSDPELGQRSTLAWGNSAGLASSGVLGFGWAATAQPTPLGGTLLVQPLALFALSMPAAGASYGWDIPNAPSLCGASVFVQGVSMDAAATQGWSFTPGLRLELGR